MARSNAKPETARDKAKGMVKKHGLRIDAAYHLVIAANKRDGIASKLAPPEVGIAETRELLDFDQAQRLTAALKELGWE